MHFLKTVALALLATSVHGSPFNVNGTQSKAKGLERADTINAVLNHTESLSSLGHLFVQPIEEFDEEYAFHSFINLLLPYGFIRPNFTASHSLHSSISRRDINATNPLILAMNATINAFIFNNITINEGELGKRAQHSWEISGGTRGPPCPGWPIWQRFNATHEVQWTFLRGNIYRKINPACPVANGHP
ncbi:hypothetical protein BDZ45DRAFT_740877 [Acephala macrosclerotiorum]|nr:hypothetical protein BDZ45DRAFT_740877 [Acephala macrosclerotiorum]